MSITTIRGQQILNGSVQRADMNTATSGQAVITKIIGGTNISLASTGMDSGTGDVTVSASLSSGTWTNVTLGTGWTAPTQAQYRVDANSMVYFRGMIQAAYSALGTTAFTVPVAAQPTTTRSNVLAGAQATGTPSDVASYISSMSSAGVCTVYPLGAGPFCWFDPSQTQQVYLDGLTYSL